MAERVNLVNAKLIARQRGLALSQRRLRHHAERYENMLTLTVGNGGRQRMVRGSVVQDEPHIVCIDELWVCLLYTSRRSSARTPGRSRA